MQFIPNIFGWLSDSYDAVADLIFFVMVAFTAICSLILFYHWRKYGMNGATLAFTELVYLTVVVVLLATAFFALN